MLQTHVTKLLGLKIPVLQAPMGGVAGPGLVEAVCSAGALGMLPIWPLPIDVAASVLREVKARVSSPFAVNLNVAFDPTAMLALALDHAAPVVHFFWGDPSPYVTRAKSRGARVMATVGSIEEGKRAAKAGVDVLVAQGIEAGGHVWGKTSLFALLPALADACPECPIVAAGAIGDGRGLAAALKLGAGAVMMGTALVVAEESDAHPEYKKALIGASGDDTVLGTLFDVGWPEAPARVIRNETVRNWERAGSPSTRPGEGEVVARSPDGTSIPRYSAQPPTRGFTGDVTAMALYAGQGVGLAKRIEPAASILDRVVAEAERHL